MMKNITEIESQKVKVQKMIQLIQKNPSLRILPMVDGELGGPDFAYYAGSFINAEIDEVHYDDERIYFRSYDEEDMGESIFSRLEYHNPSWSDTLLDTKCDVKKGDTNENQII